MAAARPPGGTRTLAAFVALVVLIGANLVAIRIGNQELAPLWHAGFRFLLAAVLFGAIAFVTRAPIPGARPAAGAAAYGLLSIAAFFGFVYAGLVEAPVGLATTTLALGPLLTLGLPTSATAAILLSAFQQYGLQPGPLLFETNASLVWGLIASFYVGNVMLLVLNLPLVGLWVKLLAIPRPQLYAGILVFATMGVYGMRQSPFDVFLLYAIGLLGFLMRRYGFPAAPVIVGMILGPLAEEQLRRSLAISQGSWSVFVTHPISAVLLAVTVAVLVLPVGVRALRRKRAGG